MKGLSARRRRRRGEGENEYDPCNFRSDFDGLAPAIVSATDRLAPGIPVRLGVERGEVPVEELEEKVVAVAVMLVAGFELQGVAAT